MKASATEPQRRTPVSLFDHAADARMRDVICERIAQFARAVARRHLGRRGSRSQRCDSAALLVALRGYYQTWSVCAPFRLPTLDEELVAVAETAYLQACGGYERRAAA